MVYLGSIGGPAAILPKQNIKRVDVMEYPELGMGAIWKIEVEDFSTFIVCARVRFSGYWRARGNRNKKSQAISEEGFEVEAVLVDVAPFDPNRIALA